MSKEDLSTITIIYKINKNYENSQKNIKIFDSQFVENNKKICKMIIDNKEIEITENYNIENYTNNELKIKLKGIDNITNMSDMFNECSSLLSLPDISKWSTNNVTDMSYIFMDVHYYHLYLIFQNGILIMLLI